MKFQRRWIAAGLVALWGLGGAASAAAEPEPYGTLVEFSAGIAPESEPAEVTKGPDGNVWFTQLGAGAPIGRITPLGEVTALSTGISPGSEPFGITTGPDGDVWFTELSAAQIGRITPAGEVTEFSTGITRGSLPAGITTGPDGNLWFTEFAGNRIGRITPTGEVTQFSTGISLGGNPRGIVAGPDGNLWFTESLGNRIGRITPSGEVTEFSAGITAGSEPFQIAAGPDGNLWFTEAAGNRIGRITPAGVVTEFSTGITAASAPRGITVGPDGNLWFTEFHGDRIGRITTAGKITEFTSGISLTSGPFGIAPGSDGNLWFSQQSASHIARFTLGPEAGLPAVTKISPTIGPVGGGTTVTITGTLLSGATSVKFGPTKAKSFTVVSATSITAVSPPGSGIVDVTVTTPKGVSPSVAADRFGYAPTVKKLTPNIGSELGGTTVSISGSNFVNVTEVSFGSEPAVKFTVKSASSISAVAPPGEGVVDVTVTTEGGTSPITTLDHFTYVPPPTVTGVSPNAGTKLGGTAVTVTGTGFALGTTATTFVFGTTKATAVNCVSTTECTLVTPKHGAGTVDVKAAVNKIPSPANPPEDQYTYQ
jgi:streptogramin lyase